MLSALRIVDRRWAITNTARCLDELFGLGVEAARSLVQIGHGCLKERTTILVL